MLETLLIIFREGLEAFLIVAIMLAYLVKTNRHNLIKPVYSGVVVALAISATTGWHVASLAQDPIWEGALAIIASILVASFTIHIMRTAKTIRQDIGNKIESAAQQGGVLAEIGIFAFTILMVAREGMETALMLGSISAQNHAAEMYAGAALGVGLVALIAYLWSTHGHKVNLRLFMQVTGIFLVLFSVELFAYGLHELSEMAAIPFIGEELNTEFHILTEPIEGALFSNLLTLALLLLPCGWMGFSFFKQKFQATKTA